MASNIERYKKDLENLITRGNSLHMSMQKECYPEEFEEQINKQFTKKEAKKMIELLPNFGSSYQIWYSEAKVLIKQLLPDRLDDFIRYYEKPKSRKSISYENYRIEDYLQSLNVTRGWNKEKVVGPDAAISQFRQQIAILESVQSRFESSLFDIQQLVQADLFDSEIEAAMELKKNKFFRAAGALAGVVLERHLGQVCENHNVKSRKKNPAISDFNDLLKKENVIDIPQWRSIQHLADIRNLCDHNKKAEPTEGNIDDLIAGVSKLTKTLF